MSRKDKSVAGQGASSLTSKNLSAAQSAFQITHQSFSGPLPPPAVLEQYNAIVPGFAERIVTMAEQQAEHRRSLEKTVIEGDTKRANWGLAAGFVVALAFLYASYSLIMNGHETAGQIIAGIDIISLVTAFIYGTSSRRAEKAEKAKVMLGRE